MFFFYFINFFVLLNRYADGNAVGVALPGDPSQGHVDTLCRWSGPRRSSEGEPTAMPSAYLHQESYQPLPHVR
jgi:hypothetical protein